MFRRLKELWVLCIRHVRVLKGGLDWIVLPPSAPVAAKFLEDHALAQEFVIVLEDTMVNSVTRRYVMRSNVRTEFSISRTASVTAMRVGPE